MRSIFTPREPFTSSRVARLRDLARKSAASVGVAKNRVCAAGKPGRDRAVDNLRGIALHADDPINLSGFAAACARLRGAIARSWGRVRAFRRRPECGGCSRELAPSRSIIACSAAGFEL